MSIRTLKKLALVFGLVSVSSPAAAAYNVCGQSFTDQPTAKAVAAAFTRKLKIAKSQGDVQGMNDLLTKTSDASSYASFLGMCDGGSPPGNEFRQVCDLDCHVQLAEYHLFEASDIQYYNDRANTAGSPTLLKPEEMAKHVLAGAALVESAMALLNSSTGSTSDFRTYLQNIGELNILRAKLYMAEGDAWYKSVSEKRIARLAYLVSGSFDEDQATTPAGFPASASSMLDEAGARYDDALWGLNEALMEIPSGDHYFDSLYLEAQNLVSELQTRRDSLHKGLLYIGIDPDAGGMYSVPFLRQRLTELSGNVKSIEQQVEAVLKQYVSSSSGPLQLNDVANQQQLDQQSISLQSYKIASIENLADQQRNALQTKVDAISNTKDIFDQQARQADLLFTMNQQISEAQNRLAHLNTAIEVDSLGFQEKQVTQRISDMQWVMNQDIATTNLQLQIDSMSATFVNMDRDVAKSLADQDIIKTKRTAADHAADVAQRDSDNNADDILKLQAQEGPIFGMQQHAAALQICQVEEKIRRLKGDAAIANPFGWTETDAQGNKTSLTCSQLPNRWVPNPDLGTQSDYYTKRCAAKDTINKMNVTKAADVLVCIVGLDALPPSVVDSLNGYLASQTPPQGDVTSMAQHCADLKSQCNTVAQTNGTCDTMYATAKASLKEKMQIAQKQVDTLQAERDALSTTRGWMDAELVTTITVNTINAAMWAAQVGVASAAQTAAAAVPRITMGALVGMAGGPITLVDAWGNAQAGADATMKIMQLIATGAQSAQSVAQFVFTIQKQIHDMDLACDKAQAAIDIQALTNDAQKYAAAQTVMDITGKSLDLSTQVMNAVSAENLDTLDCKNQQSEIDSEVAQLQLQHDSQVSQANAAVAQNDLISLAIKRDQRLMDNDQTQLQDIRLQRQQLDDEWAKTQADLDAINGNSAANPPVIGLRQRTQMQIDKINALLGRVTVATNDIKAQQSVRDTLQSQIFKDSSALAQTDIDHVTQMIGSDQSHVNDMLSFINQNMQAINGIGDLRSQMSAQYSAMKIQVQGLKDNMVQTAEQAYAGTQANPVKTIYLTNAELIATLTKGVPDFLQEKRRLIEIANIELGLLNTRVRAMTSTVSTNAPFGLANGADPIGYVSTGADIDTALSSMQSTVFANQAILKTEAIGIDLPSASGLVRQLQAGHSAEFQISPAAAGRMDDYGYFMIWHPAFSEARAFTIMDMRLLMTPGVTGCASRVFELVHEGTGFKFMADSSGVAVPILSAGPAVSDSMKYIVQSESQVTDFNNAWTPPMSLLGLWNGDVKLSYNPEMLLPLLGLPVIATYRITLPPPLTTNTGGGDTCSTYDKASFRLLIAYAMPTP